MDKIVFRPIGVIRTPFQDPEGMPIQPGGAQSVKGRVVIDPAYEMGLMDIEGFSHLILIYHFHQCAGAKLTVKPFLDEHERGVLATRAPCRPNRIGLSVVRLLRRRGNVLEIENIDVVDNTPLLDIKPYVPAFDTPQVTAVGWLEGKAEQARVKRADERFKKPKT